jgi:hypothetical protein
VDGWVRQYIKQSHEKLVALFSYDLQTLIGSYGTAILSWELMAVLLDQGKSCRDQKAVKFQVKIDLTVLEKTYYENITTG